MTIAEAIRAKNATLCAGCGVVKLTGKALCSGCLEVLTPTQRTAILFAPQDAAFATAYDDAIRSARIRRQPAGVEIILHPRDTIR